MATIIDFKQAQKTRKVTKERTRQHTVLCREGHHKWKIVQEKHYESISGKLVTLYQCEYCAKQKTQLL